MTGPPTIAVLLVELARRGIELQAAGERLRYRPVSAVTPDLAHRLSARRSELLAILEAADAGPVTYTPEELRLLAGLSERAPSGGQREGHLSRARRWRGYRNPRWRWRPEGYW